MLFNTAENKYENRLYPEIDKTRPEKLERATFALGWFWGPDASFGVIEGVYSTLVGYCGGTTVNPTYHRIGDHMESIQIEFDPSIISYDKLLRIFFQEHDYTAQPWSRQYMNGVFYHSEEQKQSIARVVEAMPGTVRTEITEFTAFFAAENYHQKFYLQRHAELMKEYQVIYPEFTRLVRSTAVARVNGFLGGYGHSGLLQSILFDLGLSEQAGIFLLERLRMREISG